MNKHRGTLRICTQGHQYYKNSSCPVCPDCEKGRMPATDFLTRVSAPARRALERKNILSLEQLASLTEKEILKLHGIGPGAIPPLRAALAEQGLNFKK